MHPRFPPPPREPFATCPATLLFSMTKFFKLLPEEQQRAFVGSFSEQAS